MAALIAEAALAAVSTSAYKVPGGTTYKCQAQGRHHTSDLASWNRGFLVWQGSVWHRIRGVNSGGWSGEWVGNGCVAHPTAPLSHSQQEVAGMDVCMGS